MSGEESDADKLRRELREFKALKKKQEIKEEQAQEMD